MYLQQHFHSPPLLGRPFLVGASSLVAPQQPAAGQWLDLSSSAGGAVPSWVVVTPSSTAAEPSESAVATASYTAVGAFVPLAAAPS